MMCHHSLNHVASRVSRTSRGLPVVAGHPA